MRTYGNANTSVGAREGVPVPTKPYAKAPRPAWVDCKCGLRHRPGAFHICIDLGADEPVVVPKPKPAPKKATVKRKPKKEAPGKGRGSGFSGGRGNNGGKVVSRIEEVIRRYEDGETTTSIAEDIGVHRKSILYALRTRGVPIRPASSGQVGQARPSMRALSEEQVAELVRRYGAGEGATVLGKAFGVSHSTVLSALRREGVAIQEAGQPRALSTADDTEIGKLYAAGASLADLGAKYGVSQGAVQRALKRVGVAVRGPGIRPRGKKAA